MMIDEREETKKGSGCAVATVLFFLAAFGFALFGFYLRYSLRHYQPAPNEPQEGDMVSALAMMLMFGAAATSLIAALYGLLIFSLRRYWSNEESSANIPESRQ